jgi:hypothetical protein
MRILLVEWEKQASLACALTEAREVSNRSVARYEESLRNVVNSLCLDVLGRRSFGLKGMVSFAACG